MKNTRYLSIRFTAREKEILRLINEQKGRTSTQMMRKLILDYAQKMFPDIIEKIDNGQVQEKGRGLKNIE